MGEGCSKHHMMPVSAESGAVCVLASGKCKMFVGQRLLDYSIRLPKQWDQILHVLSLADLCRLLFSVTITAHFQFISDTDGEVAALLQ